MIWPMIPCARLWRGHLHRKSETQGVIIALVWLAGLGAAAQFGKISVALAEFRALYPVGEVALGLLISCVGTVGLLFGVIGGALLARIGIRRAMVLGLVSAAVLSAMQALLPPFEVMIALRLLEGASHLAIVIAGPILMARHSSDAARPAVMTLWSAFFGVSYMLIALIAPLLIQTVALGGYLLAHSGWMIVLAALLHIALPPPAPKPAGRARDAGPGPDHPSIDLSPRAWIGLHVRIYRSPWLSAAALGFVCYTVLYIALLTYLPEFAARSSRSSLSAAMSFVSILTSLTFGIWLLTKLPSVRAVQVGFAITAVTALGLVPLHETAAFGFAAIAVMGATGFIPGASFAALTDLTQTDEDRSLATGALAQMGNVGTTSGPPLLAAIVSFSGLEGLLMFILVFCAAGIGLHTHLIARRTAIMAAKD